ncbi:MAG: VanZ family protein [Leptolyngbyaceae cyanobacterium CAN_BIN12]|nr:VanZ family protein [Leptolyngbyaceae cyanobacterium CAN_BIN12]
MNYYELAKNSFSEKRHEPSTTEIATRWAPKIILLSLIVIVVATLYPFKFAITGSSLIQEIIRNFRSRSGLLDVLANIVLFAPLGFGLGSAIAKRPFKPITKLLAVLLVCGAMSLGIELLQVFLPGRKPTPLDVVANAVGSGVGYLCFEYFGFWLYRCAMLLLNISRLFFAKFSLKQLMFGLVAYTVFVCAVVFVWQGNSLRGWNLTYPLSLGTDYSFYHRSLQKTLDTSWDGTISDVIMSDRAISQPQVEQFFADSQAFITHNDSVLAAYSLRGEKGTQDSTGNAPSLSWQGEAPNTFSANGATLSAQSWLKTNQPVLSISQRIQQSSQFTLSATIAAADISVPLHGSKQIIAIASPSGSGNLMLGQAQSGLSVLLDADKPSETRRTPQRIIPNIFTDTQPHRLLVTYSGFVIRIYVDSHQRRYVIDLTPNRYQIMLYLLILVPLGFLIGLIANRLKHRRSLYLMVVGGGTVLPSLMIEGFLANEGDRTIRAANVLLGMLILGGPILASKRSLFKPMKPATLAKRL